MIVVNRIGDNISVSCRDKSYSTLYTDDKFTKLMDISNQSLTVKTMTDLQELLKAVEAICVNDVKEKVEAFHPSIYVQPVTHKFYLKVQDKVTSIAIPEALVRRIRESVEKKIDVTPIVKCWERFLMNHKATIPAFANRFAEYIDMIYVDPAKIAELMKIGLSREIAETLAATYEVKITMEGLLACYKVSQEVDWKFVPGEDGQPKRVDRYSRTFDENTGEITGDSRDDMQMEDRLFMPKIQGSNGDAFYCEGPNGFAKPGHFIKVGCVHRLEDWSMVNCDDNVDCVKGLHVGGLGYIATWGGEIHTCLVDPMHIGAIPNYCGSKAIRVLQYFVDGSLVSVNHSIYHSSEYAAKTDEERATLRDEILARHGELQDKIADATSELNALASQNTTNN